MQSQCERVKGLVHQRVVLTGRHDTPTLAPAGHSLLLEHFVARSLITGAKPIHILHHVHPYPCMVMCTRTSSTRTRTHSPDSDTLYMKRKLTHTHTAHAHAHAHSHHECRHTSAARVECKPFQSCMRLNWSHHARHVFFPLCNMDDHRWRSCVDGLANAREEPDAVR
jgi:hypothetical protein